MTRLLQLTALIARLAFITEQARRLAIAAVTSLIAGLTFVTKQSWRLRGSDTLLQFFNFKPNLRFHPFHLLSIFCSRKTRYPDSPFLYGIHPRRVPF
jgi:hypothetical protein